MQPSEVIERGGTQIKRIAADLKAIVLGQCVCKSVTIESKNTAYLSAEISLICVPPRPIFLHFAELLPKNVLRQRTSRRGSMMLEVIVGAALLATLLIVINQIIVRLHAQTASVERHVVAQQTLENLLEEFSLRSWDELESAAIRELAIPEWASSKLSQAVLDGEVVEVAEPTAAKRLTLRLKWRGAADTERRPLTLTTWVYKQVEGNR